MPVHHLDNLLNLSLKFHEEFHETTTEHCRSRLLIGFSSWQEINNGEQDIYLQPSECLDLMTRHSRLECFPYEAQSGFWGQFEWRQQRIKDFPTEFQKKCYSIP